VADLFSLKYRLASTISILCIVGCAQLAVLPDKSAMQSDVLPQSSSMTYNLSETTITVTGAITLNDCDSVIADALLKGRPATTSDTLPTDAPPIDITETFTVSVATQADPRHQYQIPYSQLEGWTKQLNLSVGRSSNKTLVSINGTITDQAGPAIIAAAQAAIAIGGAIAVPAVAPAVSAGELAKAAEPAATFTQLSALKSLNDTPLTAEMLPDVLNLTRDAEKLKWKDIFNRTASRKAAAARGARTQHRAGTQFCSKAIRDALEKIGEQQALISKSITKASGTGKSTSQDGQASDQANSVATKAQARIATLVAQNHLTRQFTATWTPFREDLKGNSGKENSFILTKAIDLFGDLVAPYWLTDDGAKAVAANVQKDVVLTDLKRPLMLELFVRPWTVGRDYGEAGLDGTGAASIPEGYPNGIVYRDPALATLRTCLGVCGGMLSSTSSAGGMSPLAPSSIAAGIKSSDNMENNLIETTADVSPPIQVPVVQLGRIYVQPLRNVLFQTSTAALSVNADGSIASVGTQSSSALAAGFTAATGAANSEASAVAARNTAIGAQNTAATTAASFADTVNKSLADCLTQQTSILKAGGRPVQCQ
jgi:hypothetical protein